MDEIKLPKESDSQEIGHLAVSVFNSCHPVSWRPNPTDGDDDVGLDMQVQIVDQGHYVNMFNAQIKGSAQKKNGKNAKLNATKEYFSQSLNISTLNYYARIENPIMLVFADLAQDKDPRRCPAYFLWIDKEIERLKEGKPNLDHLGKNSHTFRIPIENILDPDLNVLPYLNDRLEKRRALNGVYATVEEKYPDPITKVNALGGIIQTKKIALDTILNETDAPWLDAPKDSIAYHLKKVSDMLLLNNAILARDRLKKLAGRLSEADQHEKSEYYYLKAYLAGLLGKRDEATEGYYKAHSLSMKIKKYHLAYLESKIPPETNKAEILDQMIDEIKDLDGIGYLRLRSKLLALKGNYKAAFDILKGHDEKDIFVLKAIIYILSGSYHDCINQIDKSISEQEISQTQKLSLSSLKARSYFYLGFSNSPESTIIPFSGTPNMNPKLLKLAWIELIQALEIASQLGYPQNVELLVDMLSILGMYFSESDIVLKHLVKLAEIRPQVIVFQECLLQIALQLDKREIAEDLLDKLPKTLENAINRIILASRNNQKLEVVNSTSKILNALIDKKPNDYDTVIMIAAECANDILKYDERDEFLSVLHSARDSAALFAVYDFITLSNQSPLEKPQAINKLYTVYESGNKHRQILFQLFNSLDPYDEISAHKIIKISTDIKLDWDLSRDEYITLCKAKITIADWKNVLELSRVAQSRFGGFPQFKAFEALALDEIGETGDAIELLEKITTGEKFDPIALEIYINISARVGLIEKAKILTTRLLEQVTGREKELLLLRSMFNIEMYINPKSRSLINICSKYGKICDQADELEEGVYLIQFLGATIDPNLFIPDEDIKKFQSRLEKYVKKFPESKVIRAIGIEKQAPEKLLSELNKITGFTEEKKEWYKRNENLINRCQVPVPFMIRHKFLVNISNFLHLWELSKIIGLDYPQYRLTISADYYKIRDIRSFKLRVPLLDEVALLVLFDLNLLSYIFKIFPKIAISKNSIINFQKEAQLFFIGSNYTKAKDILQFFSLKIDQILQPSGKNQVSQDQFFEELESIKSVYDSSVHLYYTDDVISRIYVCGDDHIDNSISTIDIIEILRNNGLISQNEAAEKYAQLCAFNVIGVPIRFMDILLVIKNHLTGGVNIDRNLEILDRHKNFNSIINLIWWYKGDYSKALSDIGLFLAYMIREEDNIKIEPNIIKAIWYKWFQKVQFNLQSETDKLHFFARSFLASCIEILKKLPSDEDNRDLLIKLWSIYNDIIDFAYGNDMDRNIENRSKSVLAQFIAEYEFDSKTHIFNQISSGLTSGTSESSFFQTSYKNSAIRIARNKEQSS